MELRPICLPQNCRPVQSSRFKITGRLCRPVDRRKVRRLRTKFTDLDPELFADLDRFSPAVDLIIHVQSIRSSHDLSNVMIAPGPRPMSWLISTFFSASLTVTATGSCAKRSTALGSRASIHR